MQEEKYKVLGILLIPQVLLVWLAFRGTVGISPETVSFDALSLIMLTISAFSINRVLKYGELNDEVGNQIADKYQEGMFMYVLFGIGAFFWLITNISHIKDVYEIAYFVFLFDIQLYVMSKYRNFTAWGAQVLESLSNMTQLPF